MAPVSAEQVNQVEMLACHLLKAGEVLDTVRALWGENLELRAKLADALARQGAAVSAYHRTRELVRTIDQLVKTTRATNFEEMIVGDLRQLYDRIVKGTP